MREHICIKFSRYGKTPSGKQKHICQECGKVHTENPNYSRASLEIRESACKRILIDKEKISAVARDVGYSPNVVREWATKYAQEHNLPVPFARPSIEQKMAVVARVQNGEKPTQIAKELNINPNSIRQWVKIFHKNI